MRALGACMRQQCDALLYLPHSGERSRPLGFTLDCTYQLRYNIRKFRIRLLPAAIVDAGVLKHISSGARLSAAAGAGRGVQTHVATPTITSPTSEQDLSYVVDRDWTAGKSQQQLDAAAVCPTGSYVAAAALQAMHVCGRQQ
jgi:hypothetical protein